MLCSCLKILKLLRIYVFVKDMKNLFKFIYRYYIPYLLLFKRKLENMFLIIIFSWMDKLPINSKANLFTPNCADGINEFMMLSQRRP